MIKLFGSLKKWDVDVVSERCNQDLEDVEVVLEQWNLVDKKYQQKSEVLYCFTYIKSYYYLINAKPNNLVFLKTYNSEFDDIITFKDQNGGPLDIKDKISLTLLINKFNK